MKAKIYWTFPELLTDVVGSFKDHSNLIHSQRWQGSDIADKPEMATHEIAHVSFRLGLPYVKPKGYQVPISPNLPWADDHFEERVCGFPINPGTEWKNWPYGKSAATFLDERGKFNHNYMERYWPKLAGLPEEATTGVFDYQQKFEAEQHARPDMIMPRHTGIMYNYGDLSDVVQLLAGDPYTRQAYLPIWFPEDTGGGSKRAPCTIGYHFLMRDGKLDVNYHIRSCDFVRHFRDDVYLTIRLLLWVIEQCAQVDDRWKNVVPGQLAMQIGSFHIFRNDYHMLFGAPKNED